MPLHAPPLPIPASDGLPLLFNLATGQWVAAHVGQAIAAPCSSAAFVTTGPVNFEGGGIHLDRFYPTNRYRQQINSAVAGVGPHTLFSYTMIYTDMVAQYFATLFAFETTAPATDAASWQRATSYKRRGGGVSTLVGAAITPYTAVDAGSAALALAWNTDGAQTVRLQLTGIAARNYSVRGVVEWDFNEA